MIQINSRVTHDGKTYESGSIIKDIEKDEATRLVSLGVAVFIPGIERSAGKIDKEPEKVDTEDGNDDNDLSIEETDDYKDLDSSYKAPELKSLAAEIGMEFEPNITKGDLIIQIITEERVSDFFQED